MTCERGQGGSHQSNLPPRRILESYALLQTRFVTRTTMIFLTIIEFVLGNEISHSEDIVLGSKVGGENSVSKTAVFDALLQKLQVLS